MSNEMAKLHPLNKLIMKLSQESYVTFDKFKSVILNNYQVNLKEMDDLCIVFHDNYSSSGNRDLENHTRSCILEKNPLRLMTTQYNKIIYNDDAIKILKTASWERIIVNSCYEGTTLIVFYHNGWHVSTRRCIDAGDSKYIKNKSYREMFNETIKGKFTFGDLNKNYVYYFILIHYKNRNIVNYSQFGDNYKEIIHVMTYEKYTFKEIEHKVPNVLIEHPTTFDDLNSLLFNLKKLDNDNRKNERITSEGFIIRIYDGEVGKSKFTVLKIQTEIYKELMRIKPNNNNIHQVYLELYQRDKLYNFLPYFSEYSSDIIRRMHESMRNISNELLDIYHATRQKRNKDLYDNLKDQYKKIIYELHGKYIKNREKDFIDGMEKSGEKKSRPIRIHDVYHYLKKLPPPQLRKLYFERMQMLEDGTAPSCIGTNCIHTKVQTSLMFGDYSAKKQNNIKLSDV